MASTRLLDLPPEIRNTIYHLVLCEYRINLTRGDIPRGRPSALTVHGKPLALQAVCKALRDETSEIVPITVVSMSKCWSSDITNIRVPQTYLHRTRSLVIDSYVAFHTDLSWFVTSMPELLEVEIHVPMDSSHVTITETAICFTGVLDALDLKECAYDVEMVPDGTQIDIRDRGLFADLDFVEDEWVDVIDEWSTQPRIIVRTSGVHYKRLSEVRRSWPDQEDQECIYVTVR